MCFLQNGKGIEKTELSNQGVQRWHPAQVKEEINGVIKKR
jgi:hypothetical protein